MGSLRSQSTPAVRLSPQCPAEMLAQERSPYDPSVHRAGVHGCFVALTTGTDYAAAAQIAQHGLKTHPGEFFLLNNLVVALAYMGKIAEAAKFFDTVSRKDAEGPNKPTYLATKGLIQFRRGAVAEGRRLYRMSVDEANRGRDFRSAVWALLHFAQEEFRYDPIMADELVKEALGGFPKLSKVEQTISRRLHELVKQR